MLKKIEKVFYIGFKIKAIRNLLSIPYDFINDTGVLWQSVTRITVSDLTTILLGVTIVSLIKDIKKIWTEAI